MLLFVMLPYRCCAIDFEPNLLSRDFFQLSGNNSELELPELSKLLIITVSLLNRPVAEGNANIAPSKHCETVTKLNSCPEILAHGMSRSNLRANICY